jgi:hypothetical protein
MLLIVTNEKSRIMPGFSHCFVETQYFVSLCNLPLLWETQSIASLQRIKEG